jgi:hypothetical protein
VICDQVNKQFSLVNVGVFNFCKIPFIFRNKDEITRDTLSDVDLIVFGASRDEFTAHEASELTNWLNGGGRILMCFTDGAEIDENVNLKNFLKT